MDSFKRNMLTIISYVIMIFFVVIILFPLFVTVMTAFNTSNTLFSTTLIPEKLSFTENFKLLFTKTEYLSWYFNTFLIASFTMLFATAIITVMGVIYSRLRFKNRQMGMVALLLVQIIPSGSTLIALHAIATSIGIYSSENSKVYTYIFLILIYTTGAIPMNTLLMKGYYDSIPRELDESAKIDGATAFQVFKQILLPLVRPMIAVTAVFTFLAPIGDVIMPNYLITSFYSADKTLAVGLNLLIADPTNLSYNMFSAGAILVAIPALLLFFALQKHIVGGLTAGGVKG